MTKKTTTIKVNRNEIIWNLINSAIAGILVFFGAFTSGTITKAGVMAAVATSVVAFCVQFRTYWIKEEGEYSAKIFKFL
jgi:hypothetical protein